MARHNIHICQSGSVVEGAYSNERKEGNKDKFVQPRLLRVKLETRSCMEIIEECLIIRCNIRASDLL